MTPLAPVPTLDELAADPAKAAGLPSEVRQQLTLRCAGVLVALAAAPPTVNGQPPAPAEPDRWLTAEEAAPLLGTTPEWLMKHYKRLPFHRKLSRKQIRFSEQGLRRWQAARRA